MPDNSVTTETLEAKEKEDFGNMAASVARIWLHQELEYGFIGS